MRPKSKRDVEYNMKVAVWARVSTTDQETENQLSNLKIWAAAKNLEVVETYSINESAYRGAQRNALEAVYREMPTKGDTTFCWFGSWTDCPGKEYDEHWRSSTNCLVTRSRCSVAKSMDGIRWARNSRVDDLNHRLDRESILQ